MPRRDSTRLSLEEDEETPLRRSLRTSTQRDAHHLNYDAKSHPLDEYTRPALYKRRLKAHKIPVIDLDSDDDDHRDENDDSGDNDDTINYGSRTRKRRSSSLRQSSKQKRRRSSNDDDDRQRCSNLDDIKKMTKLYLAAWEAAIKDLSPTEQLGFQASQYQSAWEQFAMPDEPDINDAISMEADNADDIDAMMMPSTQLNNGLNNFDLAFNATQRSAMSAADSMQDHLDVGPSDDVAPTVRHISEPRSSFRLGTSPPASGRARKTVKAIAVHEDPPSTTVSEWSLRQLARVQSRIMTRDEQKENALHDEEAPEEDDEDEPGGFRDAVSRVPSTSNAGTADATAGPHADAGKSPITRRFQTRAEHVRSVSGSSDDTIAGPIVVACRPSSQLKAKTVYEDSDEDSEQDEDEESMEEEEDDDEDDDAVKSERVSSSAR